MFLCNRLCCLLQYFWKYFFQINIKLIKLTVRRRIECLGLLTIVIYHMIQIKRFFNRGCFGSFSALDNKVRCIRRLARKIVSLLLSLRECRDKFTLDRARHFYPRRRYLCSFWWKKRWKIENLHRYCRNLLHKLFLFWDELTVWCRFKEAVLPDGLRCAYSAYVKFSKSIATIDIDEMFNSIFVQTLTLCDSINS